MPTIFMGIYDVSFTKPESYSRRLPAIEVLETFRQRIKAATLRKWREGTSPGFQFVVTCHQHVTHQAPKGEMGDQVGHFKDTPQVAEAWEGTLDAMRGLEAKAVVFRTPSSFTPTRDNMEKMVAFFKKDDLSKTYTCIWEPKGPWSEEQIEDISREIGLVRCIDPMRDEVPPGPVAFGHLPAYWGAKSSYDVDTCLESLENLMQGGAETIYLFLGNKNAFWDAQRALAKTVEAFSCDQDDEYDEEVEEVVVEEETTANHTVEIGEKTWMPEA